jgi:hypothetical protein
LVCLTLALLLLSLTVVEVPMVKADTQVGGPIVSDTTWDVAHSPYVAVNSVEVLEGVTLTVEPGVTVRFRSGAGVQVNGELIALGTEGQPIIFTSAETTPGPGDWGNIEFTTTAITTTMDTEGSYVSGSVLGYCVVEYAGSGADSAIAVRSLLIDHCAVQSNSARGISATVSSRITNNTVSSNLHTAPHTDAYGGGIYALQSSVRGNIVSDNSITGSRAYGGGIYARYSVVSDNTVSSNSATGSGGASGGGIYTRHSTVSGNTVSSNSATGSAPHAYARGGGVHAYDSTVTGNSVNSNSASGSDSYGSGGGIFALYGMVSGNIVNDNSATGSDFYGSGNGGASGGGIQATSCTVSDNTVSGNSAFGPASYAYGGGIDALDSTVSGNVVSSNSASGSHVYGGGVCARHSPVLTNTITLNTASERGAGAYVVGSDDFLDNTVVANTGPVTLTVGGVAINGTPGIHRNNFYLNEPYDVVVVSSGDISATNNYWGAAGSVDIVQQVYDWYDDSDRGKLLFVPYRSELSPDSPFPPPTGLTGDFHNRSVTLAWEGLPSFQTGWGYKVHYDSDSSLPPYEGVGLTQGDSPIDVGDLITYTLTGLDLTQSYHLAVTAYDTRGRESWYSNVESKATGSRLYFPLVAKEP